MICTFFGHRDAPQATKPLLREVLLDLITHYDVKQFYVGNQGNFDAMALRLLKEFEKPYSITYDVVLAYLPKQTDPFFEAYYTILPEEIETVPRRFAIDYRNKWMVEHSDIVITYVERPFGGAAKCKAFAEKKKKKDCGVVWSIALYSCKVTIKINAAAYIQYADITCKSQS